MSSDRLRNRKTLWGAAVLTSLAGIGGSAPAAAASDEQPGEAQKLEELLQQINRTPPTPEDQQNSADDDAIPDPVEGEGDNEPIPGEAPPPAPAAPPAAAPAPPPAVAPQPPPPPPVSEPVIPQGVPDQADSPAEPRSKADPSRPARPRRTAPAVAPQPQASPRPEPTPSTDRAPVAATKTATAPLARVARSPARAGGTRVVQAGDSLWSIARDVLGSQASTAQVAREVARLWRLNARSLGTGNPSLIRPGQRLKTQ